MYEMLTVLSYLDENLLSAYPLLQEYVARIESRSGISSYLVSGRRPTKVNAVAFGTPMESLKKLEDN